MDGGSICLTFPGSLYSQTSSQQAALVFFALQTLELICLCSTFFKVIHAPRTQSHTYDDADVHDTRDEKTQTTHFLPQKK